METKRDTVTITRVEYERLKTLEQEVAEDAGTARLIARAKRDVGDGASLLPMDVVNRLASGKNPIRVLREFRGESQEELCVAVGIAQSYLSELETGKRKGPLALHRKFAQALGVPLDLLAVIAVTDEEADPRRSAKRKNVIANKKRERGQH